jgi:hypothetical protein
VIFASLSGVDYNSSEVSGRAVFKRRLIGREMIPIAYYYLLSPVFIFKEVRISSDKL